MIDTASRTVAILLVGLGSALPILAQPETPPPRIRRTQEASPEPAAEVDTRVPLLADIPILGHLFTSPGGATIRPLGQGRSRLRLPLDHAGWEEPDAESGEIGFLEAWLTRELPRAVSGLEEVAVVAQRRRRLGTRPGSEAAPPYLEVTGPTPAVEEARTFLESVLRDDRRMIQVAFTIVDVGLDGATLDGKVACEVLDRSRLEPALQRRKGLPGAMVIMAPTIVLQNGQRGLVSVVNQEAYVKDFEVEVAQDAFIADPVIDVIQEGIVLDCGAVLDPRGQGLSLEAHVNLSTLLRPIKTFKTRLVQNSEEVTIQLPEVRTTDWHSEPILLSGDDAGIVVRGLQYWKQVDGEEVALSILEVYCQVTIIEPREAPDASGEVIAFDAASRLATVRANVRGEPEGPGLIFIRGPEHVARGTIVERQGRLLLVRIDHGAPRAGDRAQ